jgi:hypothetical protein
VYSEWLEELKKCDEKTLLEPIPGADSFWCDEISHLTIHSSYHIGQIVTARKRLHTWKDEYGV